MGVKRDEKERKENCFFKYKRDGFREKKKWGEKTWVAIVNIEPPKSYNTCQTKHSIVLCNTIQSNSWRHINKSYIYVYNIIPNRRRFKENN